MKKVLAFASGWCGTTAMLDEAEDGYKLIGGIDVDADVRKWFDKNHPDIQPCANMNLMTVRVEEILERFGEFDVIANTCPCTLISGANKNSTPFHELNAMLLRTVRMMKHLNCPAMIVENVPKLVMKGQMEILYGLLVKEYQKLKDYVWIDVKKGRDKPKPLSSLDFNTPQDRHRYVAYIIHRDLIKKELCLPKPTTIDYKPLRIGNIAPNIRFMKTGYSDEYGRYDKATPRTFKQHCFTATATVNLFDQNDVPLDIPTLLRFCGYPESWLYSTDPKDFRLMWHLAGNSVMPPFGRELFRHLTYLTT
jgi:site-specific DNA-cytosine methylase